MPEAVIRPRYDDDLPSCVEALAAVHEADRYPSNWPADPQRWLTPDELLGTWIATDGPAFLGHVALAQAGPALAEVVGTPAAELAEVARLFVSVPARRGGVARDLLAHAVSTAVGHGRQPVLEVEAGASGAIRFYEDLGWRFAGSTAGYWTAADGRRAVVRVYRAPAA